MVRRAGRPSPFLSLSPSLPPTPKRTPPFHAFFTLATCSPPLPRGRRGAAEWPPPAPGSSPRGQGEGRRRQRGQTRADGACMSAEASPSAEARIRAFRAFVLLAKPYALLGGGGGLQDGLMGQRQYKTEGFRLRLGWAESE